MHTYINQAKISYLQLYKLNFQFWFHFIQFHVILKFLPSNSFDFDGNFVIFFSQNLVLGLAVEVGESIIFFKAIFTDLKKYH